MCLVSGVYRRGDTGAWILCLPAASLSMVTDTEPWSEDAWAAIVRTLPEMPGPKAAMGANGQRKTKVAVTELVRPGPGGVAQVTDTLPAS